MEFNPSKMICDASKRPFSELKSRVRYLEKSESHRRIWYLLKSTEVNPSRIDGLVDEGWKVTEDDVTSRCDIHKKLLGLEEGLSPYNRDKALFHEINHAVYGDPLHDGFGKPYRDDNRTIVEWLARKLRSDSELLRHAVLAFDLQPHIYDAVSHEAFSSVDWRYQLTFPFAEPKQHLMQTLMD